MKEKEISRQEFDDLKSDVKDLHKVFDKITEIALAVERLATEMKFMREEQTKQDERLTAVEQKPAKRYDNIVNYIITSIIGLVIGAVAMLIGLKKQERWCVEMEKVNDEEFVEAVSDDETVYEEIEEEVE